MTAQSRPVRTIAGFQFSATDLTMLLVVLIWGANFTVIKVALQEIPPLAFAALRFAIATVILITILRLREGPQPIPRATFWKLTWVGIVGNTLYQTLFVYGLQFTTAANSALLIASVPAMVAFTGAILGIERLTRNIAMGVGLALAGVALVVGSRGLHLTGDTLIGDIMLIGAAMAWTTYTLGVRTLGGSLSPLRITTWTMITGVPGLVLISIPQLLTTQWQAVSPVSWLGLAYSTLLALVLAYVLWNNSVRVAGSSRTAIFGCAIPLVATLIAWPVLHEIPTPLQGAGAALIIAGVLLTRR